jgi:hypothetical protein
MTYGKGIFPVLLLVACQEYDVVPDTYADVFEQVDPETRADVVVVVDDSPSMAEEQDRLTATFDTFLDVLADTEARFHLGITTTDAVASAGEFRGGGWVAWDAPDLLAHVEGALTVGTDGQRHEEGLSAAVLTLEGDRNPGFRREGVPLHLLIVSDEDDGSPLSVQAYLDRLGLVAGDAELGVHGIVGDLPEGCANGTNAAAAAPRYTEAIALTHGNRASICSDDYGDLLEQVGLQLSGLPDTFPLSSVPVVDTLRVVVDDVQIPGREVDGWTYAPGDNAIVFHGRSIPRPGMQIGVHYQELLGAADTP